jgi:hypothetical protein
MGPWCSQRCCLHCLSFLCCFACCSCVAGHNLLALAYQAGGWGDSWAVSCVSSLCWCRCACQTGRGPPASSSFFQAGGPHPVTREKTSWKPAIAYTDHWDCLAHYKKVSFRKKLLGFLTVVKCFREILLQVITNTAIF